MMLLVAKIVQVRSYKYWAQKLAVAAMICRNTAVDAIVVLRFRIDFLVYLNMWH